MDEQYTFDDYFGSDCLSTEMANPCVRVVGPVGDRVWLGGSLSGEQPVRDETSEGHERPVTAVGNE